MAWTRSLVFILLLMAFSTTVGIVQAMSTFATIEVRLVPQQAQGGPVLAVEGGNRTLEVEPMPLLGPSDFAGVGAVERVEGKPGFHVMLTPVGAAKYDEISRRHVGRTLAIIVGGRIVMTPRILDPVRAQGFLLTVNTEPEARALAAQIRQVLIGR